MINKTHIGISIAVAMAVLSSAMIAQHHYLKSKFSEQKKPTEKAKRVSTGDSDLLEEISNLKKKNKESRATILAKDRAITLLEKRLDARLDVIVDDNESERQNRSELTSTTSLDYTTRKKVGMLLADFAKIFAEYIEEEGMDEFLNDFNSLIATLTEDRSNLSITEMKQDMVSRLQDKIANTDNERQKAILMERLAAIEGASDEDLKGILDYYQSLDDVKALNKLMDKYNIGREELREAGIEPPPRNKWGPDVLEVAYNLENFKEMYRPLIESDKQEQFDEDFSSYLNELTKRLTDEETLYEKARMMKAMQDGYDSADKRSQKWLDRHMQKLEKSNLEDLRRWIKMDRMKDMNNLADKYDIPRNELQQSGIMTPWGKRHWR